MTLMTIERKFSELLQLQLQESYPIDLTLNGPLMAKVHPKIIWVRLLYEYGLEENVPKIEVPGWNYECFKDLSSARGKYPSINFTIVGKPWAISKFLEECKEEAIIDFQELGTVVLSKRNLEYSASREIHDLILPHWIHYALSPELWGPHGKWIRFHDRLHGLFSELQLLEETDFVGYYPLTLKVSKLDSLGFKGTIIGNKYLLVLPWSFSLSALKKLEETIRQDF